MEARNLPLYRLVFVKYIPGTNYKGSRIKLWEEPREYKTRKLSKTFSYDSKIGSVLYQALDILERNGFKVIGRNWSAERYTLICDFSDVIYNGVEFEFKEITELK